MYAKNKASALKITEQNFPEVYAIVCEQARKLGMKKVPEVYVIQANGVLNAFSTFCLSKQYITVNAEIFEVAYREHHGIDSMFMLMVDRHIYKMVDKEDYIKSAEEQKGLFLRVSNLLADHPVACKRIPALAMGEGSGKLY